MTSPTDSPQPICLLATAQPAEMKVLQHVLRDMGLQVEVCPHPAGCLEQIKRLIPAVIFLDSTAPGLEVERLIRIVSHYPATAATAVVLIAPMHASERTRRQLSTYDCFQVLDRPLTCHCIRETVRAALRAGAETHVVPKPIRRTATRLVPACNSLLSRTLLCPWHNYPVEATAYTLRAGRVYVEQDVFDIPLYRQAAIGHDFVDFHRVEPILCPECLFTSTDPGVFVDPDDLSRAPTTARTRLDQAIGTTVLEETPRRERILLERPAGDAKALERFDRSLQQTLTLLELAIASSHCVYEAAPQRNAAELLRIGNYHLRCAAVVAAAPEHEISKEEAVPLVIRYRQAAIPWLRRGFSESVGSAASCQGGYQLVALHVWLGDDAAASGHLAGLRDLTKLARRNLGDPATLERYLRRAQALWDKRERYRLTRSAA